MNPESIHSEQKHRRQMTVACITLIVSTIAALAALGTVSEIRNHLCYEHDINSVCSKVQISESEMRVFAWYPEAKPLSSSPSTPNPYLDALTPSRIVHDIPPYEKRSYASGFPSGKQQWLYWEARLKSHLPPFGSIRFVVHWTTYDASGNPVAGGVFEATWGADDPVALIIGPVDTVPIGATSQFLRGHYEVVLKVYGNKLAESEVHGGFDIY
ncbi:hypothetical protein CLG94_00750 [Candidatus Methylomirabilis limnetica]|uniref:Uncharacterized protein n=1 Tax=Candidatus Methylomirabilis limnetica TaxID=2033718 RepID=A0A2T4U147_9BACT|nr:hypothetical protein [Candidatus Methylomirabilis limnetica]PTL37093.1 hypothetical protein CLG94_00750 [Candidatus Methylomirabilis limnetica]